MGLAPVVADTACGCLCQVGKGVTRLKGIAQDQMQELRLQEVMIDQVRNSCEPMFFSFWMASVVVQAFACSGTC